MTAAGTLSDLETRLGDPDDAANPLGTAAVLAADERGELLADGETALADFGMNAEFVPAELGGRLRTADGLARTVRAVFRRDCTLGLGYGITNFVAAAPVWTSGDDNQRRRLAGLLLGGGRAAAGYTELAHGNDFSRAELTARPYRSSLLVDGRKELINNVGRAETLVLFTRTELRPGSRSHSHLMVDLTTLPSRTLRHLPRFHTSGVRGCMLGGVEFRDSPVPRAAMIGEQGGAMETVLRAFQTTRAVLPGVMVGVLDTQLRIVLRFAAGRRLYGRTVADLPHARAVLAGVFTDLLVADCLATVGARALHVLPAETSVPTAVVKYLVPKLLEDANHRLAVLLGARSFLRDGDCAMFQKNLRDLPVVSLAHAGAAVCQATIIPQLPRMAAAAWSGAEPAPAEVFRLDAALPPLRFDALEITARGRDRITAVLPAEAARADTDPRIAALCRVFAGELRRLRDDCRELPPRDRTVIAGPAAFALADRYATLVAAAACVGVWRQAESAFLRDPAWLEAALHRLAARLGTAAGPTPAGLHEPLHAELRRRLADARTLDLGATRLAGATT
ncbi:acyl-CoA dehydrogenase family protein [Catenuloplanes indicus]|uniref:Alkylation response protein AidB-like acyl-CoA dehydrogenase n=1 Tax=Catenuloplanes indicus TaxID=137267 RepID=A0AAE4AVP2_9ACTN|nr:acyl-CoA dehydrogenase family protein [Catenuloplanes indicus]MDQ0363886.1 alkylation response protein AidB-like acyl-CoA dehydrogenase [Catenuloplanes indicus]